MPEYFCLCCTYNTNDKSKYNRHMETNKHKEKEKQLGIREQSLEEQLIEANKSIKKLTEERQALIKTNIRLNALLDKNDKIDDKARTYQMINDEFCTGFIRTEKEITLEKNNKLEDILSLNLEHIKKNIPFFKVYLQCLLENDTQPLTNFINSKFRPCDYSIDDDGDIYFFDNNNEPVDINASFRIMRRTLSSQIKKSKELYFELLNKYRKDTEFTIVDIDFNLFDDVTTSDGKAITIQFFTDCITMKKD